MRCWYPNKAGGVYGVLILKDAPTGGVVCGVVDCFVFNVVSCDHI